MEPTDERHSLADPEAKPVIQRIADGVNVVMAQMEASSANRQGAVGSLERTLSDLRARIEVLETHAQVFGVQRFESLTNTVNGKSHEDDMREEFGLTGKQTKMALPVSTVQDVVSEALSGAFAGWMDELDEKLARSTETKADMGRTLVREFERSIVARHAERLATAELKLRTLAMEIDKVQNFLNKHSMKGQVSGEESVDDDMHTERSHEMIRSHGVLPQCPLKSSSLEADVEMLRADMDRLVAVDLHTMYDNLQELQKQSLGVMSMVEQQRLALQHENHSRLREDQKFRSEIMELKERLSQAASGGGQLERPVDHSPLREVLPSEIQTKVQEIVKTDGNSISEVSPDRYHLHSTGILSSDLVMLSGDDCLPEPQTNARSHLSSTCDGTCKSSSSSAERADVQPSHMTDEVRSTLLSYLRSEFQDHVTQVLQGLKSQTDAVSTATFSPAPNSTGSTQQSQGLKAQTGAVSTATCSPAPNSAGSTSETAPRKIDLQQPLTPLKVASERISPRELFAGSLSVPVPRLHGSLKVPLQGGTPSIIAAGGSSHRSWPEKSAGGLKRAMSPTRQGSVSVSVPPPPAGTPSMTAGVGSLHLSGPDKCAGGLPRAMSPTRPGSVSVSVHPLPAGNAAIAAVQVTAKQVGTQAKHKNSARSSSPPVVVRQATHLTAVPTAVATAVPVSASMVLQQAGLLTSPRNSFTKRQ